jgi:2,5-diketo-D-gluconate reductase A
MGTAPTVPRLTLSDGTQIPQLAFDLFPVPAEKAQRTVELALEAGHRHIDTAAAYGSERQVGAALRASGLSRPDYFVTTKLWCSREGEDAALRALEGSLDRLGLDHVDLCLAYWPIATGGRFVEIWRALERMHGEGRAHTIGVANFGIADLERLRRGTGALPTVNQVELHPYCQDGGLLAWHAEHGITTAAWSPLGQGELLEHETTIAELAGRHGKTLAQVILRWHLQLGNVVVAGSARPEEIREGIELFDFALSDEELVTIGQLDRDFALLR